MNRKVLPGDFEVSIYEQPFYVHDANWHNPTLRYEGLEQWIGFLAEEQETVTNAAGLDVPAAELPMNSLLPEQRAQFAIDHLM